MTEEEQEQEHLPAPLDDLPSPEIGGWGAVIAAISAVPAVGGITATWLTQRQEREYKTRLLDALQGLARRVKRLEEQNKTLQIDDDLAELIVSTLPLIAKTRNERKRRRFAALLANATVRAEEADRDRARTMALILDQLEYSQVHILGIIVDTERAIPRDGGVRGPERLVPTGFLPSNVTQAHSDLLRLHGIGLLNVGPDGIAVSVLADEFFGWIRDV